MKHVLTPTPLPPRPIFRSEWLEAATTDEPHLPKQERVPDPPEGYHKAAYGTLAFYEEREMWRERHNTWNSVAAYCCPVHVADGDAMDDHLDELWGDTNWRARISAATGINIGLWGDSSIAEHALSVTR